MGVGGGGLSISRCGRIWCDVVWCGVVWCGVVLQIRNNTADFPPAGAQMVWGGATKLGMLSCSIRLIAPPLSITEVGYCIGHAQ